MKSLDFWMFYYVIFLYMKILMLIIYPNKNSLSCCQLETEEDSCLFVTTKEEQELEENVQMCVTW